MLDIIAKGGYVITVIIFCSLVACTVIIERWFFYRAADKAARNFKALLCDPSAVNSLQIQSCGQENNVFEKMWRAAAAVPASEREARQIAVDDAVRAEIPVLERNLYLTTELIDLNPRVVVALKMYDELEASGAELDYDSPYTLVVAVALSAQATDVSVNKATAKLFQVADTPQKMLAALPALPPVLKDVQMKTFYTTEAAKGAGKPWWLDLGVVKSGAAYTAMMDFNTRATVAMAPLRDGPLPRVTGPVYARMSDAAKAMVQTVGVSGINQMQDGKLVSSHNPHNTLVYSETPFTPEIERAMNDAAAQLNKVLPAGFATTLDTLSVVELSFSGNVLREIYRINLADGKTYDVRNGSLVKR